MTETEDTSKQLPNSFVESLQNHAQICDGIAVQQCIITYVQLFQSNPAQRTYHEVALMSAEPRNRVDQ